MSANDLIDSIARSLRTAVTTSLDLSFNELMDMHISGELNIKPDYQRLFRWAEGKRSRFIESLILEMPVPPIYVIEVDDGSYELIDGLQRISSYLHLRGKLEAKHLDKPIEMGQLLQLSDCDIVTDLNGLTYVDFPTALQIRLKRAFIRVEVVRKESDRRFRYHMFKRLNTGGDLLSNHELRNCTIRMLDSVFPDFVIELSGDDDFVSCTSTLTQAAKDAAYDQELVLRFFALKNSRASFKHDVSEFLTEYMESIADPAIAVAFDYEREKGVFQRTFTALNRAMGADAFAQVNKARTNLNAAFGVYHFEAITVGMQTILDRLDLNDAGAMQRLGEVLRACKLDPVFAGYTTGGGKNSPGPLGERIRFIEQGLTNAFG